MIINTSQIGRTIRVLTILNLSLSLSSCGSKPIEMPEGQATMADFITLTPGAAQVLKKYPGTIEGSVNVDIKAQVSGYLEKIYVQEGDYVSKGQSLFKIKSDVFTEQVNNSQATLKSAEAALASAKIEVEKIRPLVEGKVVSPLQLETAEAQYRAAAAQVAQARASLGSTRINADFALIKAPVSGYIGRIPKRIGNLVTPGDALPLTSLSEINQVFVYFSMSEADFITYLKDKKSGSTTDRVELIMADGQTYTSPGRLEIASGNIEQTTGSIPMKAIFSNPDKILRAGGSARLVLSKKVDSALLIPMAGVKDIQDKFFVFALGDSSKISMKAVEIEGRTGVDYIIKSGLKAGDKIAATSIDVLTDGMKVSPRMMTKPTSRN